MAKFSPSTHIDTYACPRVRCYKSSDPCVRARRKARPVRDANRARKAPRGPAIIELTASNASSSSPPSPIRRSRPYDPASALTYRALELETHAVQIATLPVKSSAMGRAGNCPPRKSCSSLIETARGARIFAMTPGSSARRRAARRVILTHRMKKVSVYFRQPASLRLGTPCASP